ncbi:hypothetical protein [Anatilimnocola floriformis]|uniref:hypothetical protein n=1 Tax=Anatilimnocola floriformis TaxID=2948575 RepID=UPI0020C55374|nr:hypothetical protein [Anatilimnocola floriformis]
MKRESYSPLIVAIALLLLPIVYVGSYLTLVVPSAFVTLTRSANRGNYRVASAVCSRIFWPLEKIDRKVRPQAWDDISEFLSQPKPMP